MLQPLFVSFCHNVYAKFCQINKNSDKDVSLPSLIMNVKYFSGAGILLLGGTIFKQFIFYPKFPCFSKARITKK